VNGQTPKYPDADDLGADEPTEPSFDRGGVAGRVKFDDRGNAVWEWAVTTGAFGNETSRERLQQKLEHPALKIVDEPQPSSETVRANPLGKKKGYNPYDSGKLGKPADPAPRKKKDLRRLGEFLKLKKQAAKNKQDDK
jgi:hypothetical protein